MATSNPPLPIDGGGFGPRRTSLLDAWQRDLALSSIADRNQKGLVFNIQKYSVHDGPGIRTLVFLKGCSLRCQWCSNPESQMPERQLAYNSNKCLTVDQCQRCQGICPQDAITVGDDRKVVVDMEACDNCLICVEACPSNALNAYGYEVTVDEALRRVEEDEAFYSRSGGGLTLSGGEPLFQPDFAISLLREARRRRIDTCIETCGNVPWHVLEEAAQYLNSIYYDVKCIDGRKHQEGTGATNSLLLANLVKLKEAFPDLSLKVRTPLIPGFNDSEEEIAKIVDFIKSMPNTEYELLGYHRMGTPKYTYLGREYPLADQQLLDEKHLQKLRDFASVELARLRAGVEAGGDA
jgi:pyruvate formate lyase activating enzyme